MNIQKKNLILLSSLGLSATAQTHHLTAEQAMQRVGIEHLGVGRMRQAKAPAANSLYYVFNTESGFIIASADDRARAVLGRCDSGAWNPDNIPPAMQGWLDNMSEALQLLAEIDDAATAVRSNPVAPQHAPAATRIEPLLNLPREGNIIWGQNTPFNNLCPASGSTHSATGCAATAMAQIMRYYRWPEVGHGSNSYTTSTIGDEGSRTPVSETFEGTRYDWANMLTAYYLTADNKPNNYNDTQATAVATLMRHIGVAANMDYNTGASGTTEGPMLKAMTENFDYDRSLQIYYRENYSSSDWYALLQSEIDAQRPVLMNGYSISGGHAFVIDGYDTTMGDGYFHFNWGWNGMSNGFYSVDIADPGQQGTGGSLGGYSYNQNIFTNIQPQAGGKAQPNLCVSAALRYDSFGQLNYQWLNRGTGAFTGDTGYVVDDGGQLTFHSVKNVSGVGFREGSGSVHQKISAPTKAGLRYYLASKNLRGSITAMRPLIGSAAALVSVEDGKGGYTLVPETSGMASLAVSSLDLDGYAYAGATTNFTVTVTNNGGQEYAGALYMCVTETNDAGDLGYPDLADTNPLGIYLRPGETGTYSFPFYNPLATGKYLAEVFYNPRNGSGLQLVGGQPLTFDVVPYGSHDDLDVAPELTIKSLSVAPAEISNGDEITLTATLDNAGGNGKVNVAGLIYKQNGLNYTYTTQIGGAAMSFEEGENTISISGAPDLEAGTYAIILGDADTRLAFASTAYAFQKNYPKFVVKEEVQPEPEPEPIPEALTVASLTLDAPSTGSGQAVTVYANQGFTLNYTLTNGSADDFDDFVMLFLERLDAEGNVVETDDTNFDENMMSLACGETKSSSITVSKGLPIGKYRASLCYFDYDIWGNVIFEGTKLEFDVVEYKEPADMSPAKLSDVAASLSSATVTQGDELTLTLSATNSGGQGEVTVALVAMKQISGNNYKQAGTIFAGPISFAKGANTLTFTETVNLEPGYYRFYPAYDDDGWWEAYNYKYIYLTVEAPAAEPDYNINGDGQEDAEDVRSLVNDILFGTTSEAEDLDGSNAVSVGDVTNLIQYLITKESAK